MMKNRNFLGLYLALLLWVSACSSSTYIQKTDTSHSSMSIDSTRSVDAEVSAMIAPYKGQMSAEMERVIGYAAKELRKGTMESPLGNFVADLMQEQAAKYSSRSVDMGAVTIGGLRTPIKEGKITVQDVFELMPFENQVMVLTMDSALVVEMFDYLYKKQNLAVSNTSVIYDPQGKIAILYIDGVPVSGDRHYTLAISDYLASGGDDMHFLKKSLKTDMLDLKVRDAIIKQIEEIRLKGESIDADYEDRVMIQDHE